MYALLLLSAVLCGLTSLAVAQALPPGYPNKPIRLLVGNAPGGVWTGGAGTYFPNNTALTMAHIHNNVAGQTGPIVIDTGLTAGQVTLGSGAGNFARDGIPLANLTLVQNIINNPSQFYFNVHSSLNGTGMARGQLVKQ